jgi:hypothetical protein
MLVLNSGMVYSQADTLNKNRKIILGGNLLLDIQSIEGNKNYSTYKLELSPFVAYHLSKKLSLGFEFSFKNYDKGQTEMRYAFSDWAKYRTGISYAFAPMARYKFVIVENLSLVGTVKTGYEFSANIGEGYIKISSGETDKTPGYKYNVFFVGTDWAINYTFNNRFALEVEMANLSANWLTINYTTDDSIKINNVLLSHNFFQPNIGLVFYF